MKIQLTSMKKTFPAHFFVGKKFCAKLMILNSSFGYALDNTNDLCINEVHKKLKGGDNMLCNVDIFAVYNDHCHLQMVSCFGIETKIC